MYTLSKVTPTIDAHGFNIIGMHGRPLVYFVYSQEKEAGTAAEHVCAAIAKAKLVVPAGKSPIAVWRRVRSSMFAWHSQFNGLVRWTRRQPNARTRSKH